MGVLPLFWRYHCMKPTFKEFIVSIKEMNLIIDEITAIIYSELINLNSSPNDLYSSNNLEGGKHVT